MSGGQVWQVPRLPTEQPRVQQESDLLYTYGQPSYGTDLPDSAIPTPGYAEDSPSPPLTRWQNSKSRGPSFKRKRAQPPRTRSYRQKRRVARRTGTAGAVELPSSSSPAVPQVDGEAAGSEDDEWHDATEAERCMVDDGEPAGKAADPHEAQQKRRRRAARLDAVADGDSDSESSQIDFNDGSLTREEVVEQLQYNADSLRDNTIKSYDTYKIQFATWCTSNGYNSKKMTVGAAIKFIRYLGDNGKSIGIIRSCKKALSSLWRNQAHLRKAPHNSKKLHHYGLYEAACRAAISMAGHKSIRNGEDPQKNFGNETLTQEEFKKLCDYYMGVGDYQAMLMHAVVTNLMSSAARGDTLRGFDLSHLCKVDHLLDVGPIQPTLLVKVEEKSKTQGAGVKSMQTDIAHLDPLQCPHIALSNYAFWRWTQREDFPDPRDRDAWLCIALFRKRSSASEAAGYDTLYNGVKAGFNHLGLSLSKATHAFRKTAAHLLSLAGHPEWSIARQGDWNHDALTNHYLVFAPSRTMLGLGGVEDAAQVDLRSAYWAPHLVPHVSTLLLDGVEVDMHALAFPFLVKLREAVGQMSAAEAADLPSAARVLKVMEYLASMFIRGALELSEKYPQHHAYFRNSFIESRPFQTMLAAYKRDKAAGAFVKPQSSREVALDCQMQLHIIKSMQLSQQQWQQHMLSLLAERQPLHSGSTPPHKTIQQGLALMEAGLNKLTPNPKQQALSTVEGKLTILRDTGELSPAEYERMTADLHTASPLATTASRPSAQASGIPTASAVTACTSSPHLQTAARMVASPIAAKGALAADPAAAGGSSSNMQAAGPVAAGGSSPHPHATGTAAAGTARRLVLPIMPGHSSGAGGLPPIHSSAAPAPLQQWQRAATSAMSSGWPPQSIGPRVLPQPVPMSLSSVAGQSGRGPSSMGGRSLQLLHSAVGHSSSGLSSLQMLQSSMSGSNLQGMHQAIGQSSGAQLIGLPSAGQTSFPLQIRTAAEVREAGKQAGAKVEALARGLQTVVEIWQDYASSQGGNKSKREQEMDGPAWRTGDKKFFYDRKPIFDEIERLGREEKWSLNKAAKVLEERRKEAKVQIVKLQKLLRKHGAEWRQHVSL